MSISIDFENKQYPGHSPRFRNSIDFVLSTRVNCNQTTDVRTQCMKSRGVRVLGTGNFATVIQYPYRADKVIRVSSTERVNGELDMYEDYVRYLRRSRSNNPCLPEIHGAITQQGLLFVLMDKFKPLSKPEQDKAKAIFYGEIKPENQPQQNLRDAFKLFKRSTLKADDVKGDNIMQHGWEYKIVDPLGGLGLVEPEPVVETVTLEQSIDELTVEIVVSSGRVLRFHGLGIDRFTYEHIQQYTQCIREESIPAQHYIQDVLYRWLYDTGLLSSGSVDEDVAFLYSRSTGKVAIVSHPVHAVRELIKTFNPPGTHRLDALRYMQSSWANIEL